MTPEDRLRLMGNKPGGPMRGACHYLAAAVMAIEICMGSDRVSQFDGFAGIDWVAQVMPANGVITSEFGYRSHPFRRRGRDFHEGVDIAGFYNSAIYAAASGQVIKVHRRRGYGLMIEIDHGRGWTSHYAHLSRAIVADGDYVRPGTPIGKMGRSGATTGTHLHYELRRFGIAMDPLPHLMAHVTDARVYASQW